MGHALGHGADRRELGAQSNFKKSLQIEKWARLGLNQRPLACEAIELISWIAGSRRVHGQSSELPARPIYPIYPMCADVHG